MAAGEHGGAAGPSTGGGGHGHPDPAEVDWAAVVLDEGFWDERYRAAGALWSGRPNAQLVAEAAALTPGTALDVGCGEGADATWLAERGWRVTGADISTVALERAAARARAAGADVGRIAWLHLDIARAAPPATYDLVSAQFLHPPGGLRRELHRRLAAAVAPGGALLVVGHDRADLAVPGLRPPVPDLLFSADDVADALDPGAWDVVVRASRPRAASDPEGGEVTAHDAVLLARRRPA